MDASQLGGSDRAYLEVALARLAAHGKIPGNGEREIRIRIDTNGRIKWFEPTQVRVPASELEDEQPSG